MKLSDLRNSKYLTKEHCRKGIVVTFKKFYQDNVSSPGQPADIKWIAELEEDCKDWVLNPTNGALIAGFLGSEDSDDWVGKKVVAYNDETVMFAGEVKGGIRVRRYEPPEKSSDDGDIPW